MKVLLELFWTFFKIGGLTIGGGYVMLPLIQKEVVEVKGWVTEEEVIDYYAIGQSTPGIIAVNTATFIGYKLKKIPGAIAGTLGMITPSVIIIIFVALFFNYFIEVPLIQSAFKGIRVAVIALLIQAVVKMGKKAIKDWMGMALALIAFCVVAFQNISPIWIIITSSVVGICIRFQLFRHEQLYEKKGGEGK